MSCSQLNQHFYFLSNCYKPNFPAGVIAVILLPCSSALCTLEDKIKTINDGKSINEMHFST